MTSPETTQTAFAAWRQCVTAKTPGAAAKYAGLVDVLDAGDPPADRLRDRPHGPRPAAMMVPDPIAEAVDDLRAEVGDERYWEAGDQKRLEADIFIALTIRPLDPGIPGLLGRLGNCFRWEVYVL